jgi:hypothetical protein
MTLVIFSEMHLEADHSLATNGMLGMCGVMCILCAFVASSDRNNIILSLWRRNRFYLEKRI